MLNIENAKYAQWLTECNFSNCKLKRQQYGQFIADYITGEYDGFVLNLNGGWGSGKTEFLKRLYSELLNRNYPVIYIDAWESDFSKNPLTVVTSELVHQLEKFDNEIYESDALNEVKRFCGKFLQGSAIAMSGLLSRAVTGDASLGAELAKSILEDDPEKFIDKLSNEYQEQSEAIKEIRNKLSNLASVLENSFGADLPVIVLIDELDRCRPTYAIEMLEAIKHFFKTDNFVFVIATDTEQLCHSITSVYGNDFDSKQYLKRFFDRKAVLPPPDLECYLDALDLDFTPYSNLNLYPKITEEPNDGFNKYIMSIAIAYDLKIRDLDQLINKLFSCLRTALNVKERTGKEQHINILTLLVALVEFEKEKPEFYQRGNDAPKHYTLEKAIPFWQNCDLNKLIELSLVSSIRYYRITNIAALRHITLKELESYTDRSSPHDLYFWLNQIAHAVQAANKDKYWLWDDYKCVVELAGNLS